MVGKHPPEPQQRLRLDLDAERPRVVFKERARDVPPPRAALRVRIRGERAWESASHPQPGEMVGADLGDRQTTSRSAAPAARSC